VNILKDDLFHVGLIIITIGLYQYMEVFRPIMKWLWFNMFVE
jgi:hypothetical protein